MMSPKRCETLKQNPESKRGLRIYGDSHSQPFLTGELLQRQDNAAYKTIEAKLREERAALRFICDDELAPLQRISSHAGEIVDDSGPFKVRPHPSRHRTGCNDLARLMDEHIETRRQDFEGRLLSKEIVHCPPWRPKPLDSHVLQEESAPQVECTDSTRDPLSDNSSNEKRACDMGVQVDTMRSNIEHLQHKLWFAEQLNERSNVLNRSLRRENKECHSRFVRTSSSSYAVRVVQDNFRMEQLRARQAEEKVESANVTAAHFREQLRAAEGKLRIAIDEMESMREEIILLRKAASNREKKHALQVNTLRQEAAANQERIREELAQFTRYRKGIVRIHKELADDDEALQKKFKAVHIFRTKNPAPLQSLLELHTKVCTAPKTREQQ